MEKLGVNAENCIVVGDRIKSEIVEGSKIGCKTIWLKRGKFAKEQPESDIEKPDYTVTSLSRILPIISKLTN